MCLVCAAIEITHRNTVTHRRLVAGGIIQASTAVTAEQVHEQMRLERRGVAKMGAQAFTLTNLTLVLSASRGNAGLYLQVGRQALHCAYDVHIRPESKTAELAVYARDMSRAVSREEQVRPLEYL